MQTLPNVGKITYSEDFLSKLSPAERQAAYYGVEKRFLYFARKETIEAPNEGYDVHCYRTLRAANTFNKLTLPGSEQCQKAIELLGSGLLWSEPAGIIVLNSPDFIFTGKEHDAALGIDGFLAHLVCSLAHRVVVTRKASGVDVNYLETTSLDHNRDYHIKQRHLLIWGPVTDHFSAFDCNKTVQFLFTFRNHTRILLTSTPDVGELLAKLKVNIDRVSYFFNFEATKEEGESPDTKKAAKSRKPKKETKPIGGSLD